MKSLSTILPLLTILLLLPSKTVVGQEEVQRPTNEYLKILSGITFGPWDFFDNTMEMQNIGFRIGGEYKREFGKNWLYGVSLEGLIPLVLFPQAMNVSFSVYYRLPLVRDRFFLLPGVGLGGNFVLEGDEIPIRVVPTISGNLSLLWRVSPATFIEFSPLLVAPTRLNIPIPTVVEGEARFKISLLTVGIMLRL